jgi:hypothetical protein
MGAGPKKKVKLRRHKRDTWTGIEPDVGVEPTTLRFHQNREINCKQLLAVVVFLEGWLDERVSRSTD